MKSKKDVSYGDDLLKIKKTSLMKSKFKAWVRAHKHCFGLWHLGERFTEKDVSYGADGILQNGYQALQVGIPV